MAYVIEPSSGEVPIVPDDRYLATIVSLKPITLDKPDDYGKTQKIVVKVEFEVDDEIVTLDPRVNPAWSEKATLFLIAVACGFDVDPSVSFDIEQLEGKQCYITTVQETGKWPRVQLWSRVPQKKGAKAAQEPVAASAPAVTNPDGSADYDAFWRGVKALGLNGTHVAAKVNGDLNNLQLMDGPDVAFLLEELKLQVEAAV